MGKAFGANAPQLRSRARFAVLEDKIAHTGYGFSARRNRLCVLVIRPGGNHPRDERLVNVTGGDASLKFGAKGVVFPDAESLQGADQGNRLFSVKAKRAATRVAGAHDEPLVIFVRRDPSGVSG